MLSDGYTWFADVPLRPMARVVPFLVSELCLPRATPIEEALADREAYAASVRRLRALEPVRVHVAHDPDVWERA
jgi:hypothetical protein